VVDRGCLVRLFGYRGEEAEALAAVDHRIAVILKTQKLAEDLAIDQYWAEKSKHDDDEDAPEYVPPPAPTVTDPSQDPALLKREFRLILQQQCARLESLLAAHEAEEPADEPAELTEQAAFDDSAEGERLHRYQFHWSRSLLRTLDAIAKLRKNGEQEVPAEPGPCGAGFQSCPSIDQEESIPARRDCPTGTAEKDAVGERARDEERPDRPVKPARNKATGTPELADEEGIYAVVSQSGESMRPVAERRRHSTESKRPGTNHGEIPRGVGAHRAAAPPR
jgi:hypothetical protein